MANLWELLMHFVHYKFISYFEMLKQIFLCGYYDFRLQCIFSRKQGRKSQINPMKTDEMIGEREKDLFVERVRIENMNLRFKLIYSISFRRGCDVLTWILDGCWLFYQYYYLDIISSLKTYQLFDTHSFYYVCPAWEICLERSHFKNQLLIGWLLSTGGQSSALRWFILTWH